MDLLVMLAAKPSHVERQQIIFVMGVHYLSVFPVHDTADLTSAALEPATPNFAPDSIMSLLCLGWSRAPRAASNLRGYGGYTGTGVGRGLGGGLEAGWNWLVIGVGRGLEPHSTTSRKLLRFDAGPSCATRILPSVSNVSIAARSGRLVMPSEPGCPANRLGA